MHPSRHQRHLSLTSDACIQTAVHSPDQSPNYLKAEKETDINRLTMDHPFYFDSEFQRHGGTMCACPARLPETVEDGALPLGMKQSSKSFTVPTQARGREAETCDVPCSPSDSETHLT